MLKTFVCMVTVIAILSVINSNSTRSASERFINLCIFTMYMGYNKLRPLFKSRIIIAMHAHSSHE